jgi:threonine aldolase
MFIDLRSDTVTRPTPGMLAAIMDARVGDDVFEEDPAIIELEQRAAELFGKEAAIFCPSGTMTNQIAIKIQTQPQQEVICDKLSHIYLYEGGGLAFNSGVSVRLLDGDRGRLKAEAIADNINPDNIHQAETVLVSLENTSNKGGGSYYRKQDFMDIAAVCRKHQLKLHLDGARIFNALVETNEKPQEIGVFFDTISVCLSKGLGAPVGSLLIASNENIKKAKRVRKVFGGGMRQAGFLAAAGLYALENNVGRLKEDHQRAREIEKVLVTLPYIKNVFPVDTNIIVFRLDDEFSTDSFISRMKENNILVFAFGKQLIRMVTHLDFNDDMLDKLIQVLKKTG